MPIRDVEAWWVECKRCELAILIEKGQDLEAALNTRGWTLSFRVDKERPQVYCPHCRPRANGPCQRCGQNVKPCMCESGIFHGHMPKTREQRHPNATKPVFVDPFKRGT